MPWATYLTHRLFFAPRAWFGTDRMGFSSWPPTRTILRILRTIWPWRLGSKSLRPFDGTVSIFNMSASRITAPALTPIFRGTERERLLGFVRCPHAITPRQPFAKQVASRHSETVEKDVRGTVNASAEVFPVDGEVLGSVGLAVARARVVKTTGCVPGRPRLE